MSLTKVSYSMINGDPLNVLDYGAVGNSNIETGGGTDDTAAIQAAVAAAVSSKRTLFAPTGYCFRVTDQIDMRSVEEIQWLGQIYVDNVTTKPGVIIGGFSNGGSRKKFFFNEIHDGGSRLAAPTYALLRVFGLKGGIIEVPACRYVEIYADSAVTDCGSNGYNTFIFGHVYKLQLKGADANSWVNENYFIGGRHSVVNIATTTAEYLHNHNVWAYPTLEGVIQINIANGYSNIFRNCRWEGVQQAGTQLTFGATAFSNYIETDYDTGPYGSQLVFPSIDPIYITDAGSNNIVTRTSNTLYKRTDLFRLDARTQLLVSGTIGDTSSYTTANQRGLFDRNQPAIFADAVGMLPGLDYIKFSYTFRDIFQSQYIPSQVGDAYGIEFDVTSASMRYAIRVYDANYTLLGSEGGGGSYIEGSGLTYNGAGTYSVSSNINSNLNNPIGFGVQRSEVKYIKIYLMTGGATPLLRAAAVFFMEKPNSQLRERAAAAIDYVTMNLPSVPTGGYVEKGTMVSKDDGASIYICTFNYRTTLNGAVAGGGTSVTVAAAGGIANGDVVGILLNDGSTHWSVVSALSTATFTVAALPSAAASGNSVVFNRWATK